MPTNRQNLATKDPSAPKSLFLRILRVGYRQFLPEAQPDTASLRAQNCKICLTHLQLRAGTAITKLQTSA